MPDNSGSRYGAQGWRQFLQAKRKMLSANDIGKVHAEMQAAQTNHGRVAEGEFRKWLEEFLPRRYAVTSGFVVSQRLGFETHLPHYDVIIYDAIESPVLWFDVNPDSSATGKSRAIPVEHVRAILEIKAALTPKAAREAIDHLGELQPFLASIDAGPYATHLPATFACGVVFFEIRKEQEFSATALNALVPQCPIRGYFGAIALRGEGLEDDQTAEIVLGIGDKVGDESNVDRDGGASLLRPGFGADSASVPSSDGRFFTALLMWSPAMFAAFAFNLVARLNGTYRPGFASSFHGLVFQRTAPQEP